MNYIQKFSHCKYEISFYQLFHYLYWICLFPCYFKYQVFRTAALPLIKWRLAFLREKDNNKNMIKVIRYLYLYILMVMLNFGIFIELLCIGLSLKHMFYHSCWFTVLFTEMFSLLQIDYYLLNIEIKCCVMIYCANL